VARSKGLGEFEILVLTALVRLGPDAYGARIRDEIEARAGRRVSVGALYTTLNRMEDKGFIRGRLGAPTAARGGRAKRYFRLTARGEERLRASLAALGAMLEGVAAWPAGAP